LLQKSETEENSEKKAGAVSKRRRLIASGDVVPDITSAASNPQFIEMHNLERGPTTVSQVEEGEGIEIEGPIRPSSYYAMT
jgi:hypothetical protein